MSGNNSATGTRGAEGADSDISRARKPGRQTADEPRDGDGDSLPEVREIAKSPTRPLGLRNTATYSQTVLQHLMAGRDPNDLRAGPMLFVSTTKGQRSLPGSDNCFCGRRF